MTKRRIYVLSEDLISQIESYQIAHGFKSETETVRHLLSLAMSMKMTGAEIKSNVLELAKKMPIYQAFSKVVIGHPSIKWFKLTVDEGEFTTHSDENIVVFTWEESND